MHVALLANTAWLDEELATFRQLAVGLIDESVRVAQVLPRQMPAADAVRFGERLDWNEARWRTLSMHRLAALAEPLNQMDVDLVHALDGRLWPAAARVARQLDCPLVLSANDSRDTVAARSVLRHIDRERTVITARTMPMHDRLREVVGEGVMMAMVRHGVRPTQGDRLGFVRWPPAQSDDVNAQGGDAQADGVGGTEEPGAADGADGVDAADAPGPTRHAPAGEPTPPPGADPTPRCLLVSGNGRWDRQYAALFEALRGLIAMFPKLQVFLDGQINDQRRLWREARAMSLLRHVSLIPRRVGHREDLLRADLLVHPQVLGKARRLTTQAMDSGMPVVSVADPLLDYLVNGRTARLLSDPTPDAWVRVLSQLLEHPDEAAALARTAREWTAEHCGVSAYVEHMLGVYRRASGETLAFQPDA